LGCAGPCHLVFYHNPRKSLRLFYELAGECLHFAPIHTRFSHKIRPESDILPPGAGNLAADRPAAGRVFPAAGPPPCAASAARPAAGSTPSGPAPALPDGRSKGGRPAARTAAPARRGGPPPAHRPAPTRASPPPHGRFLTGWPLHRP